jgi:hypothetical protein
MDVHLVFLRMFMSVRNSPINEVVREERDHVYIVCMLACMHACKHL